MTRSALASLAVFSLFLSVGCGDKDGGDTSGTTEPHDHSDHGGDDGDGDGDGGGSGDAANGEAIYSTSCAACHGANGEGVSAPAMTTLVPGMSASAIATVALEGSGGMPPVLSNETDADDVAAYAVATWGP